MLGLTIAGCGDDDGGDTPEEQCENLFKAVCSKAAECAAKAGAGSADDIKEQCLSQLEDTCEDVEAPPDDVDVGDCIDAIEDVSCGDFEADTLPEACGD